MLRDQLQNCIEGSNSQCAVRRNCETLMRWVGGFHDDMATDLVNSSVAQCPAKHVSQLLA